MKIYSRPKAKRYWYYALLPLNSIVVYVWAKLVFDSDILGVYSLLIMILELTKASLWNPQARLLQLDTTTNPDAVMISAVGLGNMISGSIVFFVSLQFFEGLRDVSVFVVLWCGLEGIKYAYSSVFIAKGSYGLLIISILLELIVKFIILVLFGKDFAGFLFLASLAYLFMADARFLVKLLRSKPIMFATKFSLYLRSVANAVGANFDRILLSMLMSLGEFGNFSLVRAGITRLLSYGQNVLEDTYKYNFYKTLSYKSLMDWFLLSALVHIVPLFLLICLFYLEFLTSNVLLTYIFVIVVYFLYYLLNNQYNIALAISKTRYFVFIDSFLIASIILIFLFKNDIELSALYFSSIFVYITSVFLGFLALRKESN